MCFPQFFSRQPEDFGGKIPFIVSDLVEQLKKLNADQVKGIFRLSGSARDSSLLCANLDTGRVTDWSIYTDPHCITGALKRYFREKTNDSPFFPYTVYDEIISIAKITQESKQIEIIQKVFSTFSRARLLTAVYLFKYLLSITRSVEVNSMTADNLAIVFSPNLLCLKDPTPEQTMIANAIHNKTISIIIRLIDASFSEIVFDERDFLTDDEILIISPPPLTAEDLDKIRNIRNFRKKSLIPCIPAQYIGKVHRPTRVFEIPPEFKRSIRPVESEFVIPPISDLLSDDSK